MSQPGAWGNIIPVTMTEVRLPEPEPQVFIPECGSRWGKTSEFQFLDQDDNPNAPVPPEGQNETWEDDEHVDVNVIESLWSPMPSDFQKNGRVESVGGQPTHVPFHPTWDDPFGIKRSFDVFERKSEDTFTTPKCDPDPGPIKNYCAFSNTLIQMPGQDMSGTISGSNLWLVQSTSEITCDMGDQTEQRPTGFQAGGTETFDEYIVHRHLLVNFDKGAGSGASVGIGIGPDEERIPPTAPGCDGTEGEGPTGNPGPNPKNIYHPTCLGVTLVGKTMHCIVGVWEGNGLSFTFEWRSGGSVVGDNENTYLLTSGDVGKMITVNVKGTSSGGNEAEATTPERGPVEEPIW